MRRKRIKIVPGFKLPVDLLPKPNTIKYSKPTYVEGVLISVILEGKR